MTLQNFETAFERVRHLVSDFQQHEKAYLSPAYSEQDVRKDFIDKFWIALGWDVNHEQQTNPNEREVKVESSVQVEGRRKKADYAFLASNFRDVRFFVEAKKPARNIDNADDYFQTVRYGWNAQTPLSILTDFEQFRVLDCRYKPDIETALNRAIPKLKLHYTEYAEIEKFREIYYLFSREAVTSGKLDKFAAELPKPTGKAAQRKLFGGTYKSVDEDFLQELDELRDELARSFKVRNLHLNGEDLTEATQRTLDRLVFMRFLEDKLIEPEAIVERLGVRGAAWADFVAESERLNKIYNGIIFKPHFIDRADFIVDERVFAGVRERLAHTNTVYNFNYIPIHVLGSIYERFLGKVIVATDKRARVEEKPEVRKAGGVYYTPAYIVRYIVEQTIGRLIEGKTPEEIALMRFADIACGSGSFLLGVYDELLRYHTAYYNEPKNRRKALKAGCIETADGSLRLSLNQRKDILLNNIYGVDLDAQAVEVAQLSLFLKLLEDETTASAKGFQLQFRETMLPSLDKNVIHGNSLIGWDISSGLFDDEEERKLVPMDFEQAFPEVMRRGGFDAIVGNPPYGQILDEHAIKYTQERIPSFKPVKDVYVAFMERAPQLLKDHGKISFIVPSAWLGGVAYKPLRETIGGYKVEQVVALPFDVFKDAYVDTLIFIITKTPPSGSHVVRGFTYPKKVKIDSIKIEDSQWNNLLFSSWLNTEDKKFVLSEGTLQLIERFKASCSDRVGDFLEMKRGVLFDKTLLTDQKSAPNSFPYFEGDVYRYQINLKLERWIEYGANMREYPKEFKWFEGRRILMRRLVNRQQRMMSCIADETFITNKNLYTLLTKTNLGLAAKFEYFALGILNSSLISKLYLDQVSQATKDDFPQVTIKDVLMLPMPTPDHARHDRMVNLVEQMLASKRQLQTVRTDSDRNHYENKCAALDRQIDALVYELYELTPDEIAIVENV